MRTMIWASGSSAQGGLLIVLGCLFVPRDPLAINCSAIQSRGIGLSPEPKIIVACLSLTNPNEINNL